MATKPEGETVNHQGGQSEEKFDGSTDTNLAPHEDLFSANPVKAPLNKSEGKTWKVIGTNQVCFCA